jgi:hypothetical protein
LLDRLENAASRATRVQLEQPVHRCAAIKASVARLVLPVLRALLAHRVSVAPMALPVLLVPLAVTALAFPLA